MVQQVLVALTLLAAAGYLVHHFVLRDRLRRRRPDVPLGRLRKPKSTPPSACH